MIKLTTFAEYLQNNLNVTASPAFKIFCDVADYNKAVRTGNTVTRYRNAMLTLDNEDITPIKNWMSAVTSCTLSIAVDVDLQGKDASSGNYNEVEEIRTALQNLITTLNGQTTQIVDTDTFEVTTYFGSILVGAVEQTSPLGKTVDISLDVFFTYVENGMNANDVTITVDGENLAFVNGEVTRVKTQQAQQFSDEKNIQTITQQNGISIDLRLPYFNTTVGNAIWEDILSCDEQNRGHLVSITNKNGKHDYFMIFGEDSATLQASKNITFGLNMVEGKPEMMENIGKPMIMTFNVTDASKAVELGLNIVAPGYKAFADWGDGSGIQILTNGRHKYASTGTKTVKLWGNPAYFNPICASFTSHLTKVIQWGTLKFNRFSLQDNTDLTSIPWNEPIPVFNYNTTNIFHYDRLSYLFSGCSSLTYSYEENGSAERLFENHKNATNLNCTFLETAITETPYNVYAPFTNLESISECYLKCYNLQIIYNDFKETIGSAVGTFGEVATATENGISFGEALNLPNLLYAWSIFKGAKLGSIDKIFTKCTKIRNLDRAFEDVIWTGNENLTEQFLPSLIPLTLRDVKNIFYNTVASPKGTAQSIWNTATITSHSFAFRGCDDLDNYSSIPAGWN